MATARRVRTTMPPIADDRAAAEAWADALSTAADPIRGRPISTRRARALWNRIVRTKAMETQPFRVDLDGRLRNMAAVASADLVRFLISIGANPDKDAGMGRGSSAQYACRRETVDMGVIMALDEAGVDWSRTKGNGGYLHDVAHHVVRGDVDGLVDFLVARGADVAAIDHDGWTPLDVLPWGTKRGDALAAALIRNGATASAATYARAMPGAGIDTLLRLAPPPGPDIISTLVSGWTMQDHREAAVGLALRPGRAGILGRLLCRASGADPSRPKHPTGSDVDASAWGMELAALHADAPWGVRFLADLADA